MELGIGSRVKHEEFGVGVVIQATNDQFVVTFVNFGVKEIDKLYADEELTILEKSEPRKDLISLAQVEETLKRLLGSTLDYDWEADLGDKWIDGKLEFHPGRDGLKSYELPIETFFHKIVMVRDRLRVMEQRINSSGLTDEEKVNLQQYITKIYGSLTSFNILFDRREDGFVGSGGK